MFEQAGTSTNRFGSGVHGLVFECMIRESLIVLKWELASRLAYDLKNSNNAQKLPTYSDLSVDQSEKQKCLETLICTKYIGENDI